VCVSYCQLPKRHMVFLACPPCCCVRNTRRSSHRYATPNTKHQTPNTKHQTPNTKHQTHNTQHTTHNTQHTTHNTQHTTHNTQHITHNTTPHHNTNTTTPQTPHIPSIPHNSPSTNIALQFTYAITRIHCSEKQKEERTRKKTYTIWFLWICVYSPNSNLQKGGLFGHI
jgi:hypothetical protein